MPQAVCRCPKGFSGLRLFLLLLAFLEALFELLGRLANAPGQLGKFLGTEEEEDDEKDEEDFYWT